ncbi:hypothetical protein ACQY0O_004072 [Thecaphora frezii]
MSESALAYLEADPDPGRAGIYYLLLNRPASRNAISRQLLHDFRRCLSELASLATSGARPAPRVLIVQANGPAFCAGADLKERNAMDRHEVADFLLLFGSTLSDLESLPLPTIAAIEGAALGGGLELALACDFRVAGEVATLASFVNEIGFPEVTLGIIPGAGGTQRAPRIIGLQSAKDLIYTGRRLTAAQAYGIGLVDHVAPGASCLSLCHSLAVRMLPGAPRAVHAAKMAMHLGGDVALEEALEVEWEWYQTLLDTRDRKEALDAFREKRKPVFTGM